MAAKLQSSASNIKSFVIKFSSIKSIPYLFHIIFATLPLPLTLLLHLPATSSPICQITTISNMSLRNFLY